MEARQTTQKEEQAGTKVMTFPLPVAALELAAAKLSGNAAIISAVEPEYARIPGYNARLISALSVYDFTRDYDPQHNPQNWDMKAFWQRFADLVPLHGDVHAEQLGFSQRPEESAKKSSFERLKTESSAFFRDMFDASKTARKEYEEAYTTHGVDMMEEAEVYGLITEFHPTMTRQDILLRIAGMPPQGIRHDLGGAVKLSELRAMVRRHEFQHALTQKVFAERKNSKILSKEAHYKHPAEEKLWQKMNTAGGTGEPYFLYLNECLSDTAAMLGHLRDGGSDATCEAWIQAREAGVVNSRAPHYGTQHVLRHIYANRDELRQKLAGLPRENGAKENEAMALHRVAVAYVAEYSLDRGDFYDFADGVDRATELAWNLLPDAEKARFSKRYELCDEAFRERKYSTNIAFNKAGRNTLRMQRDVMDAHHLATEALLPPPGQVVTTHPAIHEQEQAIEQLAACQLAQQENPDFAGPAGMVHLLKTRQRILQSAGSANAAERCAMMDKLIDHYQAQPERTVQNTRALPQQAPGPQVASR